MKDDRVTIIIQKGSKRIVTHTPMTSVDRLVFVVNHQYTNAPNTTHVEVTVRLERKDTVQ